MSTKTSTRTARATRNHSPRTGLVQPETEVILGAEVLMGTDAGEVAEALAEIAAEAPVKKARKATVKAVKEEAAPVTHKKLTSRELAMQALDQHNTSTSSTLKFANHVLGNLTESGAATFAVLDGDTKLRMDVATVVGGGAEVVKVYAIPAKVAKDSTATAAE